LIFLMLTIGVLNVQRCNTKRFVFRCKIAGHQNELSTASFSNKKCKVPLNEFCIECAKEKNNEGHTKEYIQIIKEKTGHTILTVDFTTRKVTYQCGNCKSFSESFTHNMLHNNTGVCSHCQNWKNRVPYNKLKEDVESYGMKLVTRDEQYTGNKQMLDVICECGKPYQMILNSIRQDKKCLECKSRKFKNTCMERYGVENVMSVPEIFDKKLSSSFTKKIYVLEDGREVNLMGYEPRAINHLLKEGIEIEQIILGVTHVPSFSYEENGKNHMYYPDFYIPHLNLIVEIKSDYTLVCHLSKNKRKLLAVAEKGYQIRLMVYNDKIDKNDGMISNEVDLTFSTTEEINKWFDDFTPKDCHLNNINRFRE
jgi:hypothetical protein